jgi:uncharacterized phage-like protein YoqJ
MTSVAVTGHQPFLLGGYGQDVAVRLRGVAREWLAEERPREIVSGLAAGWDIAVAEAAIAEGIPLVAALAYRGQADHWPEDAKRGHAALVAAATDVWLYAEEKAHGCYTRRDHWVLDRADVVLALWSGVDGGTARAVAKAYALGKPVINLWVRWCGHV